MEIEIEIAIEIDWMRLPSGMSPIDPDFDFDFDSSVALHGEEHPVLRAADDGCRTELMTADYGAG